MCVSEVVTRARLPPRVVTALGPVSGHRLAPGRDLTRARGRSIPPSARDLRRRKSAVTVLVPSPRPHPHPSGNVRRVGLDVVSQARLRRTHRLSGHRAANQRTNNRSRPGRPTYSSAPTPGRTITAASHATRAAVDMAGFRAASTRAHSQITSAGNPINISGITVSTLTDRTLAPGSDGSVCSGGHDAKQSEPHTPPGPYPGPCEFVARAAVGRAVTRSRRRRQRSRVVRGPSSARMRSTS